MRSLFTIFIISLFIISGCSSNVSVDEMELLKEENAQLIEKNKQLEMVQTSGNSSESDRKNDNLNREISILKIKNDELKETISRYQKAFELLNTESKTIVDTLSIFSPEQVQIGDQIAGLTVTDAFEEMNNDLTSYFFKFTGEFEVKGSIVRKVLWGSGYGFIVRENLERMPHMLYEFERGGIYFDINNDEELLKVLGGKLENLDENDEIEIEAVFKDYYFNYVPETDYPSFAEFVRLVSESE